MVPLQTPSQGPSNINKVVPLAASVNAESLQHTPLQDNKSSGPNASVAGHSDLTRDVGSLKSQKIVDSVKSRPSLNQSQSKHKTQKDRHDKKQPNLNKMFDNMIMVLIIISSILLVIDRPLKDPNSVEIKLAQSLEIFFTLAFLVEALIKIIALGFISNNLGKQCKPYIKDYWNILDFFVVCVSVFDLVFLQVI